MTRQAVSTAAAAALALILLISAIEKLQRLREAGPLPPAVAVLRMGSVARRRLVAVSMAADLAGASMLAAWPTAGLVFTLLLIAVYTLVGLAAFRRTGGGDCACLGARLDARSSTGLIARNLWLIGAGIVGLALGPVAFASSAREPEAWLVLLAFLAGVVASARLGDGLDKVRRATSTQRGGQASAQRSRPSEVEESAPSEARPANGCCQNGPMRGELLPEKLRSRIERAGRRPPLVVAFVSETCRGCKQLLAALLEAPELASSGRVVLVTPESSSSLWRGAADVGVEVIEDDGELWTESDVSEPPLLVATGADGTVLDKALSPHIDRFATRLSIV